MYKYHLYRYWQMSNNLPLRLHIQVVRARKRVWGIHHWWSIHMLHPSRPRPVHTLWDMGGGIQPTRKCHLWRHIPGYLRRGWVCDLWPLLWSQVFSSWPACNTRGPRATRERHSLQVWVEAWQIASACHSVINIFSASFLPTYSRIPEKPYSPRFFVEFNFLWFR